MQRTGWIVRFLVLYCSTITTHIKFISSPMQQCCLLWTCGHMYGILNSFFFIPFRVLMTGQSLNPCHHTAEGGSCLVEDIEASFLDAIWQILSLQVGKMVESLCSMRICMCSWSHCSFVQVIMGLLTVKAASGGLGLKTRPWIIRDPIWLSSSTQLALSSQIWPS